MKGYIDKLMLDLILVINPKESKKTSFAIIEAYLCNNIVNKKGKYGGGVVEKVNIINLDRVNNFNQETLKELKEYIEEKSQNISMYQYAMSFVDLRTLYQKIDKRNIFYYWNRKNEIFKVSNIELISEYHKKLKDEITVINDIEMIYAYKSFELYLYSKANNFKEFEVLKIKPKARLIFTSENLHECSLRFEYNGIEINDDFKSKIITYNHKIIPRDYSSENKYITSLKGINYKKGNTKFYYYHGKEDIEKIKRSIKRVGFEILILEVDKRKKIIKPTVNIIEKGYDWFGLEVYCKIDDKIYNLVDKIDLSSNKNYIKIDNKVIEIPKSLSNQYDKLEISEDKQLILPKKNFWSFLQIAKDSDYNLYDFIDYNKVKIELSDLINEKIKSYQIQGVKWLKWLFLNKIGGCLSDDMGLGKTFQVIAMLSDKQVKESINKILIVVPKSLITNWCREFESFSSEKNICIYHGNNRRQLLEEDYKIYITTYNTAANDISYLSQTNFDLTIFDEIQYIKNFNTQTYKKLLDLNTKVRIGLSGTPMENNKEEIWNILNILNPGMLGSKRKFKKRYSNTENNEELHYLLNPFFLRRTKLEVLNDLPEKRERILYCDFEEEQKAVYESVRQALKNEISNSRTYNSAMILKGLLLLREICCHPSLLPDSVNVSKSIESCKFEVLKLKVSDLYSSGEKILIFSQFTKMLKIIEEWLKSEEINYFYLDGQTKDRQRVIDDFQNSDKSVFLMSLKAGGVGLNLTSAQNVIIYDPWWNPFAEEQAADRVFRIGQKNKVTIYKMIVTDSIEEKILSLQTDKKETFESVFSGISKDKNIDLKEIIKLI
ncbi:TPA: DEAD/DEAH box helicase [Clostridium perfringens]